MTMKSVPLQVNSTFVEMNRIQSRAIVPHARPPASPPMRTKAAGACPQTVGSQRAAGVHGSDTCVSTLWMATGERYIGPSDLGRAAVNQKLRWLAGIAALLTELATRERATCPPHS